MTEEPVAHGGAGTPPPDPGPTPGGPGAWLMGAFIGALIVAVIIGAWLAGKDEGKRQATRDRSTAAKTAPATTPTSAASGPGKQLFAAKCGSCHTLQDAGTSGTVGPNLDDLKPDAAIVLAALKNGGTGSGTMPPGLYQGKQAQDVADYIAAVTGGA